MVLLIVAIVIIILWSMACAGSIESKRWRKQYYREKGSGC